MTATPPGWDAMRERLAAPRETPGRPHVSWQWYVDGVRQPEDDLMAAIAQARAGKGFVWCGMRDPDDDTMATFQEVFGLHELAVEDAVEGHTRSKLEIFDETLFMVIATVDYVEHTTLTETSEIVSTGEIMVYLGDWFVMTSRRRGRAIMNTIRRELESEPDELAEGPWRVLYAILDHVIDDFGQTVREIERDVEDVEAAVFAPGRRHEIDRPYQLKRELIDFKRCVFPLSQPVRALETRALGPIPEEARVYFREVSDHLVAARESVVAMDEVLGTILQAALARASVSDGQDMRRISAAVAMFAVPTTLGAIYGMNFEHMPELDSPYGYPLVLLAMVASIIGLAVFFRRRGWL
ncbi:MAG: magnesium and cobalt transport protein CorA [Actinomycetes bacterium]